MTLLDLQILIIIFIYSFKYPNVYIFYKFSNDIIKFTKVKNLTLSP